MNQRRNLRSASDTTNRLLAPMLWMLILTNSTTQSMMCQELFLDVTKISEPEGNKARAGLGRSADSWSFSPHDRIPSLPLGLSIVQFENQGCKNGDRMIVIADIQNETDQTVLFPATRDNSFDTSDPSNIVAALRLVVREDKTPINRFLVLFGSSMLPSSVVKIPGHKSLRIKAPLEIRIPDKAFMGHPEAKPFNVAVNLGFLRGPMNISRKVDSNVVELVCRP